MHGGALNVLLDQTRSVLRVMYFKKAVEMVR